MWLSCSFNSLPPKTSTESMFSSSVHAVDVEYWEVWAQSISFKTNCPSVTRWFLMRHCSFSHCWQRGGTLEVLKLESMRVGDVMKTSLSFTFHFWHLPNYIILNTDWRHEASDAETAKFMNLIVWWNFFFSLDHWFSKGLQFFFMWLHENVIF